MRLWDAESGKLLADMKSQEGSVGDLAFSVLDLAFSPDGRRLATANTNHTAGLWDVESGRPIAALRGHVGTVYSVAFSPDGQRLATASWDRTARLWDGLSGQPLAVLRGHTNQDPSPLGLQPGRSAPRHRRQRQHGAAMGCRIRTATCRPQGPHRAAVLCRIQCRRSARCYRERRRPDGATLDRAGKPRGARETLEGKRIRTGTSSRRPPPRMPATGSPRRSISASAPWPRPDEADLKERLQIATVKLGK